MSMPTASRAHLLSTAIMFVMLGACSVSSPTASRPGVEISVAPLTLPGVEDACYTLTVKNDAGQIVSNRADVCASVFGSRGGITYIATCDASDTNNDGSATNTVTLTIDGLYAGPNKTAPITDFINPCSAPHAAQGCQLSANCSENADTAIVFNLTLMRQANQGFFDVAVNFDDIFCSAKLDCTDPSGLPLKLLHNPLTGLRDQTAVVALACTTGPGGAATHLLRDPVKVTCDSGTTWLAPTFGKGNAYGTGSGQILDPEPADAIWQYAVYAGSETLDCGGSPCDKRYWNLAVGFDPTAKNCILTTAASAVDAAGPTTFSTPANANYPVITWNVSLTTNAAPASLACSKHPLNGVPSGVGTTYTGVSTSKTFAGLFNGTGFEVGTCPTGWSGPTCATPVCSPACVQGQCTGPNTCNCTTGWQGAVCDTPTCTSACLNGGTCTGVDTCTCPTDWTDSTCSTPVCTPSCQNGGTCVAPNDCDCTAAWTGNDCSTPFNPLTLDGLGSASAAYSLRRLSSSYSGAAIRIRRTHDNAETDIGFDTSGHLDTHAITAFIGPNHATVTRWYDQSGYGRDLLQTTPGKQPSIATNGLVHSIGSRPSINFSNGGLTTTQSGWLPMQNLTAYVITKEVNHADNAGIFSFKPVSGDDASSPDGLSFNTYVNGSASVALSTVKAIPDNPSYYKLYTVSLQPSLLRVRRNGSEVLNTSISNISQYSSGPLYVGERGSGASFNDHRFNGYIQELILFQDNKLGSAIESAINSYYDIYWDGTKTGMLDSLTGASQGLALRALRSAYTGPLVRVRRASDNAELDIGARGDGTLDIDMLTTFVGGSSAVVRTWYDQSGAARHASQISLGSQPRLVSNGAVDKANGKPAIRFDGTDDYLQADALAAEFTGVDEPGSFAAVVQLYNVVNYSELLGFGNSANATEIFKPISTDPNRTFYVNKRDAGSTIKSHNFSALDNHQMILVSDVTGTQLTFRRNGVTLLANADLDVGQTSLNTFTIGALRRITVQGYATASFQEVIVFPTNRSADRPILESDLNTYYGTFWDGNTSGILDTFSGPSIAYSTRALSSSYRGPILRARRNTDGLEMDIHALKTGKLDTDSLLLFAGPASANVAIWYDQSGQANHMGQTNTAKQPLIVSAGTLMKSQDKPVIRFDGSDDGLTNASGVLNGSYSLFIVSSFQTLDTTDIDNAIFAQYDGASAGRTIFQARFAGGAHYHNVFEGGGAGHLHGVTVINPTRGLLSSFIRDVNQMTSHLNGKAEISTTFSRSAPNVPNSIGSYSITNNWGNSNINMSEVIAYGSAKTAQRASIESALDAHYGIMLNGPPPLDTYTASAAYSVRKLDSDYTGSAIRVRRSSDNAELDIGFTAAGDLDTASLLSFAGSGMAYVSSWYDQSGNGRHAIQPTGGSQPYIVASGALVTSSGRPAVRFSGSSLTTVQTGFVNLQQHTLLLVTKELSHVQSGGIVTYFATSGDDASQTTAASVNASNGSEYAMDIHGTRYSFPGLTAAQTIFCLSLQQHRATLAGRYNGALLERPFVNAAAFNSGVLGLGYRSSGLNYSGVIQEAIILDDGSTSANASLSASANGYFNVH